MAPRPMRPTVTRLLGATAESAPRARAGMISGTAMIPAAAIVRPMKVRRERSSQPEGVERGVFMRYRLRKAYMGPREDGSGNIRRARHWTTRTQGVMDTDA